MFVFTRNKPIVPVDSAYKRIRPLNPLSRFLIYLLLISPVCACSAKGMTPEVGENIKDYTAIQCAPILKVNLRDDVLTQAATYYEFRDIAMSPHDVKVHLNGLYATGTSQIDNHIFDIPTRERLGYGLNDVGFVRMASVLVMPSKVEKEQVLQFSDACQINTAILENQELSRQLQGVLYLLASRKSFILRQDGSSYKPDPNLPVKFSLLNPQTHQMEEAVIPLSQMIGGDNFSSPASLTDQFLNLIKNLLGQGKEDNKSQWSVNRQIKVPQSSDYPYFTLTKQEKGEVIEGEIINVEFVPEKMN